MSNLIPELVPAIEQGYNILLSGLHGIGKTYAVKDAVGQLGLSMKYYSTSTLDPYVDLVGVPVPVEKDGVHHLHMVRPDDINNVDVVFFDELNRADPKTLNAVFEIIQFRTINGEPLNIKSVIAAINPADGDYNTEELDPALQDRFHLFFDLEPRSPKPFLIKQNYDANIVNAFVNWWMNQKKGREYYCSPRRLEYMVDVYSKTKSLDLLKRSVPPGVKMDWGALKENIRLAEGGFKFDDKKSTVNSNYANSAWWTKINVQNNHKKILDHFKANPNDPLASENFRKFICDGRIGIPFLVNWAPLLANRIEHDKFFLPEMKKRWSSTKIRGLANKCYSKHYGATGVEKEGLMKVSDALYKIS